ncbi:MAG: hypothetical protein IPF92_05045 [Myxococcales bacterium]|nr:hypothetical protein [Myxococcales bacterium]MBL0197934.1 hypothetical protein [Myxococcales bacterium]HQY63829.1 hypothetical protein [Polyangiaceae bacterium]
MPLLPIDRVVALAPARLARAAPRTSPPPRAAAFAFAHGFALTCGLTLGALGCSKPARLTGTFTGPCTFAGSYRGGGRADSTWTRTCTLTLEDRGETEVAMRFDSGDAIECYGHATQRGQVGTRAASFAANDLTCRAKTLPAPVNIAVEQCAMPGTFELTEKPQKNGKVSLTVEVALAIADKRACVVSYLEKVRLDAKLSAGGAPVELEAFTDAGIPAASPAGREPPLAPSLAPPLATPRDAGATRDAATPRDGAPAGQGPAK